MRIAVTSIALNEANFVERWSKSALDADLLVIGDTGSNDETVEAARDLGITVHEMVVKPWRFDMARNTLLTLTPPDIDIIIHLDLDEILVEGWRDQIEAAPKATRYHYDYVFSWNANGTPDIRFAADKCHSRFGWIWRYPCHEVLHPVEEHGPTANGGFAIHHHPDPTKSRGQYLPLLIQAARELPDDARVSHYLAREYFFHGKWDEARKEFVRHLSLKQAVWGAERAQSYRYLARMDYEPERWLWRAVGEDVSRRDAMVDLVDLYLKKEQLPEAVGMANRALRVKGRPGDYMTTAHAYDDNYLQAVADGTMTKAAQVAFP